MVSVGKSRRNLTPNNRQRREPNCTPSSALPYSASVSRVSVRNLKKWIKNSEKRSRLSEYILKKDKFFDFFAEDTEKGIPEGDLFNIFERFSKKTDLFPYISWDNVNKKDGKREKDYTFIN
ncbi:hypothetical protein M2137_002101 [Parabacteroides sp. PFB2-10]|uniref:hypothetical protein n=1 Tax=Parabacteroides sp. PFB2-10 TaxID=1742405 RepID=UPI00247508AE|nr:hypothetical protein [Parabacteroides sp. PFB2-10]MDH6313311.1 hypothetical protein [Parabacteroides sp. PFB2-10]